MRRSLAYALCIFLVAALQGCGSDGGKSTDLQNLLDTRRPTTDAAQLGSLTLTAGASSVVADGISSMVVRATLQDAENQPAEGISVEFATSFGGFAEANGAAAVTRVTNAEGVALVNLISTDRPALALVTATAGGLTREVEVRFVPGPPVAATSSVTANPRTVVADGVSTTTVTVTLKDGNGLPVRDGTAVTLVASAGTVVSPNPVGTSSGRAELILRAPLSQTTAELTIAEVPGISDTVIFGVAATGEPAGIRLSVAVPEIAVAGVGQVEQTQFLLQVVDVSGDPISEVGYADLLLDNLRVSFASRPNGGEYLTGVNAAGQVVRAEGNESFSVRTHGGSATLNLQSGRLPGVIELRAELLVDALGDPLASPIKASLPLATIASGPPHSIVLTLPMRDAIQDRGGVYRLVGTAIVNDRWGNPVPDGTAIYLGVLDSIIAAGTGSASGTTLTATTGAFDGTVRRNDEPPRGIQQGDRVLLFNEIASQDKSRFVASVPVPGAPALEVQSTYSTTYPQADYVVGASLLGVHILGTQERGNPAAATSGLTRTKEGLADVFMDYPANVRTLNVGCGAVPLIDTRHPPVGSADVVVVAESATEPGPLDLPGTDRFRDRAVTVSEDFCSYPMAGFTVATLPASLAGTGTVNVVVRDGTDVRVAFAGVTAGVEIREAPEGAPFTVTAQSCITGEDGTCASEIVVSGATLPGTYDALVRYQAGDGQGTVTVRFTR